MLLSGGRFFGATRIHKQRMRFSSATSAALLLAGLLLSSLAAPQAAEAKRKVVPLPDANPKRSVASAQSLPDANPKRSIAPAAAPPNADAENPNSFDAKTALKPLLAFKLTKSDRENLKASISGIYKRRYSAALGSIKRIKDKDARKLALWYYYRSRGLEGKATDIEAFRVANPHWPSQARLRQNAERSLFVNKESPEAIKSFFADTSPETGAGRAALAAMHVAEGDKAAAQAKVSEAWRNYNLTKQIEKAILDRFSELLTEADHKARVDKMLYQDRKARIAAAQRAASHLPKAEQKKIAARIAVVQRLKKAGKLLDAIPEETSKADIGFHFSRIQWLRRHKKEEDAWALLRATPDEPSLLLDLNEWWIERRVNVRAALNAGHPEIAYDIASNHGPLTGKHYAEAEFLAGWIALRFLNQHETAEKHFLALRTSALTPKRIARAEYWLARSNEAAGRKEEAVVHYTNAAGYRLTYYGQLASQKLNTGNGTLRLEPTPTPTEKEIESFLNRDAVKAIAVARSAGLERLSPLFFHQLARTLKSSGEVVLLAELARIVDQPHASVRLGKIALNRGHPTAAYAFPTDMMPDYKQLNGHVDPAFLLALSRQESEFNPNARSPVGASGLMQLMPATARKVARQYKVRYRKSRLTKDPSYNVMLGVAFLSDLLEQYKGSYVLSLVAYNAGGSRAKKWMKHSGDPRKANVDVIDWVERIPFTETRNYVQKILTTVQIFRSRLGGPEGALRLTQDLNRTSLAPKSEVAVDSNITGIAADN